MDETPRPDPSETPESRDRPRGSSRRAASDANADPADVYSSRRHRFADRRDRASRRARRLAAGRLTVFLVALALGVAAERAEGPLAVGSAAAAMAGLVGFVVLVRRHRRARRRKRWFDELHRLQVEALARLSRRWEDLPDPGPSPTPPDHPYAADLDVFGPVSLRALLSTVSTAPGRRTVDAWLASPPSLRESHRRQEAVRELAGSLEARDRLAAHGRLAGDPPAGALDAFVRWCEAEDRVADRPWLVWTARLLPLASTSLIVAHAAGLVDRAWWLLPLAAALVVTAVVGSELEGVMDRAETREAEFARFARMLELLGELPGRGALLGRLRRTVASGAGGPGEASAPEELRRLDRILGYAEFRHNDLVHLPFQLLFLWDVHVVRALDRWRDRTGRRAADWLDTLGRTEALAALAALRHDHPGWTLPHLDPASPRVEARDLEHPLLPADRSVPNDVDVGPPGTFLLVTGSNMSGKSTLLRALGLAAVLARAGGPAPARSLRLPPLRVHTSMRVEDSIARGVSTYMAELERLRDIVATARSTPSRPTRGASPVPVGEEGRARDEDRPPGADAPGLLYLLDEPLQGTNEAERREALRTVLRHLLRAGSIGAVATHDLRLHRVEDLAEAARPVHFGGTVRDAGGSPELTFDYRLRDGPATSTNALELLEMVGLGPGPGPDPGQRDGSAGQNSEPS